MNKQKNQFFFIEFNNEWNFCDRFRFSMKIKNKM
jgi:hypothetical protein